MIQDKTTIAIVCSCGRRLTVPKHLGGKRIKCVRCSRAIGVPSQAKPAAKSSAKAPPLPIPPSEDVDQEDEEERNPAKTLAGVLAGLVVALLLLLLLFWFWPREQQIAGTHGGQEIAKQSGGDGADPESTDTTTAEKEGELEKSSDAPELDVEESDEPVEDPDVVEEEEVGASEESTETEDSELTTGTAPAKQEETELSRAPAQGGTRKTISGLTQSTMAGVKVYGSIALVCDVSGSMRGDLPSLIKELRSNFPHDTPLIFVHGCSFNRPTNQTPTKGYYNYSNNFELMSLINDPHVYTSSNTTDAIIFAARELKRDTVMFNNDLQDSGTEESIDAMEKVHKEFPFRLSGRSLERDAPKCLIDFIKRTGGDFVVDPIYRVKQPAMRWAVGRRR